ncbi:hypothetical protein TNIN_57331 [Trichonephila inaurata madagascariensis]|uniref:Uncharacterized protein n=1 Tax=Trichonephila inaurata madagascariensis TaxID=2747483 RepID=A0A8X7BV21_9ARAC|nr:hypothetical protein TNIN_57331 [Trichonephila inaurata madagascariensis]
MYPLMRAIKMDCLNWDYVKLERSKYEEDFTSQFDRKKRHLEDPHVTERKIGTRRGRNFIRTGCRLRIATISYGSNVGER